MNTPAIVADTGAGAGQPARIDPTARRWLLASLVAVWLGTAAVSAAGLHAQGRDLLLAAGLQSDFWIAALILGGAAADVAVGLWLWWRPGRPAYATALALMGAMTVLATLLLPALWLDPLGRLLKNLPIAATLCVLWRADGEHTS
ncbi:DoxX-like family protein [Acidovorax sp. FG27]|uniref:DoxX-like family protein n=1 Tax=Acidovorax sp. FG27 TaxID=3133652 RepID=UPI0030EA1BEF